MALAIGLLILRVGVGLTMAAHGSQKLFGWFGGGGIHKTTAGMARQRFTPAWLWTWVAAIGEFGGGLVLALGLFSPLGGFGVLGAMLVAIVASHLHKGFWNRNGGVEFPLMIALPALALTLIGPGHGSSTMVRRRSTLIRLDRRTIIQMIARLDEVLISS